MQEERRARLLLMLILSVISIFAAVNVSVAGPTTGNYWFAGVMATLTILWVLYIGIRKKDFGEY